MTATRIDPATYPQYQRDADNPFASMDPAKRDEEIDSFCSRLWARTCAEASRKLSQVSKAA